MYLLLDLPPGMYKNGTMRQARGRWYAGNLVRWFEGTTRPIGGWRQKTYTGTLTNPFSTTNASSSVTVTQTSHGLRAGDQTYFANAAVVGGLNMNMVNWPVATVVDANNYTFLHAANANATVNAAGGTVNFTHAQKCTGQPRALLPWKDNSAVTRAGIGTNTNLYVLARDGQLTDITPTGFTAGAANATSGGGYGNGAYGVSTYGTARGDFSLIVDADVWTLDTWGQDLVGVMPASGVIYIWALSGLATAVANAPTAASVIVTDQQILMALGAGGNPRLVQWSDQDNNTTWTPAATNQAGSFQLQTAGRLMLAKNYKGAVVILSDLDAWLATYTGDVYVYSFNEIGDGCGAISRASATVVGAGVVWMGVAGFWLYNGALGKLPCDVADALFTNLNVQQQSKITCWHNSAYSEITWYYPSLASTENDSYVTWNYAENHWSMGTLAREAGADRGVMNYPLVMGTDGFIYEHEAGFAYQDAPVGVVALPGGGGGVGGGAPMGLLLALTVAGSPGGPAGGANIPGPSFAPYLESGPFEFGAMPLIKGAPPIQGNGDLIMHARQLLPDDKTAGDVSVTFKTRFYPDGAESTFGPYTVSQLTDVRFSGRQLRLRYDAVRGADWRVGSPRLDVVAGGRR